MRRSSGLPNSRGNISAGRLRRAKPRRWRCGCTPRRCISTRRGRDATRPLLRRHCRRRAPASSASVAKWRKWRRTQPSCRHTACRQAFGKSCRCCSTSPTSSHSKRARSLSPARPRARIPWRCSPHAARFRPPTITISIAFCSMRFRAGRISRASTTCRRLRICHSRRCARSRSTMLRRPRSTTPSRCAVLPMETWRSGFISRRRRWLSLAARRWTRLRGRDCPRSTCPDARSPCCRRR